MGFWQRFITGLTNLLPTSVRRQNEVETYTAGLFGLSLIVVLFGFIVVMLAPLARPTLPDAVSTGVVAMLNALMCLAGGAILGLLFGIPRYSKRDEVDNAVAPNNNLEQISDWLTKMIVGITLVQFDVILQRTKTLARQINSAVLGCPQSLPCADNYAVGLAIIGFFGAAGFLMMYLWSRIYLLLDVDNIQRKIDEDAVKFKRMVATGRVQETTPNRERLEQQAAAAVTMMPSVTEIRPGADPDDPWKGAFGGNSKNTTAARELSARVTPMPRSEFCTVRLEVRSTDPGKPLQGEVRFFLHDTFPKPVETIVARDGAAVLEVASWSAFTVGALADGGATPLELDLSTVGEAPAEWRSR